MPRIAPFSGLVYDPAIAGPLDRLTAPPYDVISESRRRSYLDASAHNIVHLDLAEGNDDPEAPDNRYVGAAERLLHGWTRRGVLRRTPPAYFAYELSFELDGAERRIRGVFCAMDLEPWGDQVLPHEHVMPGPVEDRLCLLRGEQKKLNDALATAEIRLVDAKKALADFDREQSVEGFKKQLEQASDALQVTNSEIGNLQSAWNRATSAAAKYRQKALEIRSDAQFKGKDRARAGLPEDEAQLDASVEYGTNYFKLQGLITEIQSLVGKGDEDSLRQARLLGDQAEKLAERQEALMDQLKPSDAESAANRIAKQTAQLFDTLAALEDQQAQTAATALAEAELQYILLDERMKGIKASIDEIKDTDLVLKRVTLVEQLDAAIAKTNELQGKLAEISGPNPLDTLGTSQRPAALALIEKGIKPEVAVTLVVPEQTEGEFNAEVSRLPRSGLAAIEKGLPVEEVTTNLLSALRLAGLVHLSLDSGGKKRYAARIEAIQAACAHLIEFLTQESHEN